MEAFPQLSLCQVDEGGGGGKKEEEENKEKKKKKNLAQLFPKIHAFLCNQSFSGVNTRRENQQPWQPSASAEARNDLHFSASLAVLCS